MPACGRGWVSGSRTSAITTPKIPSVSAIVFWFLVEGTQSFLTQAVSHNFLGADHVLNPTQVGPIRFVIVGLLIMLLVIFRPQGFLGSRTEVMLGD